MLFADTETTLALHNNFRRCCAGAPSFGPQKRLAFECSAFIRTFPDGLLVVENLIPDSWFELDADADGKIKMSESHVFVFLDESVQNS